AMKFMILFLNDERALARLSEAEIDRAVQHHQQVGWEYIAQKGMVRSESLTWCGARLGGTAEATTLRVRAGKYLQSDGPFAETKEVLGGFNLIDGASRQAAIEWAHKMATRDGEVLEIRPVQSMWWIYHG